MRPLDQFTILGEDDFRMLFSILSVHLLFLCRWLALYSTFSGFQMLDLPDSLGLPMVSSAASVSHT